MLPEDFDVDHVHLDQYHFQHKLFPSTTSLYILPSACGLYANIQPPCRQFKCSYRIVHYKASKNEV